MRSENRGARKGGERGRGQREGMRNHLLRAVFICTRPNPYVVFGFWFKFCESAGARGANVSSYDCYIFYTQVSSRGKTTT